MKKFFSLVLALVMALSLTTVAWGAAGTISGDGSAATPYLIEDAADLAAFRDAVNGGNTYSGKIVKLTADIDLANNEWTPIGNKNNQFKGTFDGNSKTISNLKITGNNSDVGLFGFTSNGEVKNFTLENVDVKGYLDVGAVAGTPYTSKYTDITVKGLIKVEGYAYVGGALGKNAYANVTNVDVIGSAGSYVKADSENYRTYVGGLIGFMGEGGHTVKDCDVKIDVIGSTCDVGGLLGILHYGNKLENCTYEGSLAIAGDSTEFGALVGVVHTGGSTPGSISGCSATVASATAAGSDVTDTITPHGDFYNDNHTYPITISATVNNNPVTVTNDVAKVGNTGYITIAEAVANANGGTVTLLDDVTLTSSINVTDAVTIDGNNKTITMDFANGKAFFNASGMNEGVADNLTVKNLKMVMTGATKQGYAVVAKKADSAFAISFTGCHFENMWCGVMLNGCGGTVAPTVTITDSSFKDVNYGLSFAEEAYAGDVSFENNTMAGEISIQETFPAGSGYLTTPTVVISSGSFTSDVTDYLADGMSFVDGTVVKAAGQFVGSGSALTSSTATYGATLADALANKTHTVEVKAALEASASLKSFQTYQVFVTKLDDKTVSVLPNQYIVVPTATNADIVVVDGSKIVYLAAVAGVTKYNDAAKAVKVAYDADPDCGDVYVAAAADAGTYYLYKNAYYVECAESSASIVFNVDGVAVYAKATPVVKTLPHTYGFDVKTVAGKTSVTSVYCTECKATFSFVVGDVEDAVKTFGAGNYADIGLNDPNGDDIFVRIAVVSVPVGSTTLVESAETFDAGIAMYVGMSVMAAAGSAVVLKKKD